MQTVPREPNLTERAEAQLQSLILERSFQPGEKLPSENEMGRLLGVSRTVVREAVRTLVAKGLVEARNGSGIYVRALGAALMTQPLELLMQGRRLSIEQLVEVREAIEIKTAMLAAERATADDIRALEESIEVLRGKDVSEATLVEADLAFNRRLAAASQNPLLEALSEAISTVLRPFVERVVATAGPAARQHSIDDHQRILGRVKARDPDGARRAVETELGKARTLLETPKQKRAARRPSTRHRRP